MADVHSRKQRSYNMSQIKSKNTKPEIKLKNILRAAAIKGYRSNYKIEGTPDLVFVEEKLAVFLDGCYWHKCPKCYVRPKSNTKFWDTKIDNNVKRDKKVNRRLRQKGWKVVRVWEHELKRSRGKILTKIRKSFRRGE